MNEQDKKIIEANMYDILAEDRIEHICNLVDLEFMGMITRDELIRRLTDIVKKKEKENE